MKYGPKRKKKGASARDADQRAEMDWVGLLVQGKFRRVNDQRQTKSSAQLSTVRWLRFPSPTYVQILAGR